MRSQLLDADPRGRGHRAGPWRRQRRGPAAVLRRGAVPGGGPLPHPGRRRRSATNPTIRSSTMSPTCAVPHRPMRASGSCRTPRPSCATVDGLRAARPARAGRLGAHRNGPARSADRRARADRSTRPLDLRADDDRTAGQRSRARSWTALERSSTAIWRTAGPSWPRSDPRRPWPADMPWSRRRTCCCDRWPTRRPGPTCASGSPTARYWPSAPARSRRATVLAAVVPATTMRQADQQPTGRPTERGSRMKAAVTDRTTLATARGGPAAPRHQLRAGSRRTRRGGRQAGGRRAEPGRVADAVGARRATGPGLPAVPGRRAGAGGRRAGAVRSGARWLTRSPPDRLPAAGRIRGQAGAMEAPSEAARTRPSADGVGQRGESLADRRYR